MTKRAVRPAAVALFATLLAGLSGAQGTSLHAQDAQATPATPAPPPAPPPTPSTILPAPAPTPAPRTILPAPPLAGAAAPDVPAAAELEALVAPIALYPDPLLGQLLVAATYPLEIVQAQQWLARNPDLNGDSLLEAARTQPWDPSVQSLVAFPDVIKRLSENISWTTDLGNAFLAQQSELMDAVQRLRLQAQQQGKLTSSAQQSVATRQVEQRTVVEIQPTSTQIVYVPVYSPAAIWGPPVYPYPTMYYPPPRPGALLISFGVGMAVGAAIHHGGWGYGCGWGHSNVVVVNHHNTFIHDTHVHRAGGSSSWQHDARHRGNVPYANTQVASRYGGSARAPRQAGTWPAPRDGAFGGGSHRAGTDGPRGLERSFAADRARGGNFGDKRESDFGVHAGGLDGHDRRVGRHGAGVEDRGGFGDKRHVGERDGPRGLERSFEGERARRPARESSFEKNHERSGGGFSQRGGRGEKHGFSEPASGFSQRGAEKRGFGESGSGFSQRGSSGHKRDHGASFSAHGASGQKRGDGGAPRAGGARHGSGGKRQR